MNLFGAFGYEKKPIIIVVVVVCCVRITRKHIARDRMQKSIANNPDWNYTFPSLVCARSYDIHSFSVKMWLEEGKKTCKLRFISWLCVHIKYSIITQSASGMNMNRQQRNVVLHSTHYTYVTSTKQNELNEMKWKEMKREREKKKWTQNHPHTTLSTEQERQRQQQNL